jgi:hypothetical protein
MLVVRLFPMHKVFRERAVLAATKTETSREIPRAKERFGMTVCWVESELIVPNRNNEPTVDLLRSTQRQID